MALEAQNNPFTSVLMVGAADPEALPDADPAAGSYRFVIDDTGAAWIVDSTGVATAVGGGSTDLDAIIAASSGQDIADALSGAAAPDAGNVFATMADVGGGTVYEPPNVTNVASNFAGSGTSLVLTMTAPTAGDNLVMVVYPTGRGANSITQTNVVWTQRYTGNGNSQWLEVWTGVVSASAGTTATLAFTGSNVQYAQSFVVSNVTPFTSATALTTATNAASTLITLEGTGTVGDYVVWGVSAALPSSAYHGCSQAYTPVAAAFGGAGRCGITRLGVATPISLWSLSSGSSSHFAALVKVA